MTIMTAITGDDLLTALASIAPEKRSQALSACGLTILREAADLCGVESSALGKRGAVNAIIENF